MVQKNEMSVRALTMAELEYVNGGKGDGLPKRFSPKRKRIWFDFTI
jgi:hypothetical protein